MGEGLTRRQFIDFCESPDHNILQYFKLFADADGADLGSDLEAEGDFTPTLTLTLVLVLALALAPAPVLINASSYERRLGDGQAPAQCYDRR